MAEFMNWVASLNITGDRFFGTFMAVCVIALFAAGLWVIFGNDDDDDLFK